MRNGEQRERERNRASPYSPHKKKLTRYTKTKKTEPFLFLRVDQNSYQSINRSQQQNVKKGRKAPDWFPLDGRVGERLCTRQTLSVLLRERRGRRPNQSITEMIWKGTSRLPSDRSGSIIYTKIHEVNAFRKLLADSNLYKLKKNKKKFNDIYLPRV